MIVLFSSRQGSFGTFLLDFSTYNVFKSNQSPIPLSGINKRPSSHVPETNHTNEIRISNPIPTFVVALAFLFIFESMTLLLQTLVTVLIPLSGINKRHPSHYPDASPTNEMQIPSPSGPILLKHSPTQLKRLARFLISIFTPLPKAYFVAQCPTCPRLSRRPPRSVLLLNLRESRGRSRHPRALRFYATPVRRQCHPEEVFGCHPAIQKTHLWKPLRWTSPTFSSAPNRPWSRRDRGACYLGGSS